MRSRNPKANDANNSSFDEPENLSYMSGGDLIQIPDEPNAGDTGDDYYNDNTTDEDDKKLIEVADKHAAPLNMSTRRRADTVPHGAAAALAQPILLLDEFLRSKALPAKKRKLAIAEELAMTQQHTIQKVATKPTSGGESPFHQQTVSTSTPVVGVSRMDQHGEPSSPLFGAAGLFQANAAAALSGSTPTAPIDDDYHFLLSLHPYMGKLSDTQKLRLRMKIQGLVYQELYSED